MVTIPSIQQLKDVIINNLQTQFGVTIPTVGKSVLRTMSIVWAGVLKMIYLAIGNVQKNIWPDSADQESKGGTLERFGRVKLGRNPFAAVAGIYEIIVTGEVGAVIPASQTFKSDDDSTSPDKLFILDTEFTFTATSEMITLRALTPGSEAELSVGDTLTSTSPISNVDSGAEVYAITTQPLDAETIEDYREAVLNAFRLEPKGGAATDYILWAQDAQGTQTVYPYAKSGFPNELEIFVEATLSDSIDGKGTPSAQLLLDVEDVIEYDPDTTLSVLERGRRPLGIFNIDFLPVTIKEIDIEIVNWTNTTAAQLTAVTTAIKARINQMRPFVAAAYPVDQKDDIIDENKIIAVIVDEEPAADFDGVIIYVNNVAMTTYQFLQGNIPYPDTVTNV